MSIYTLFSFAIILSCSSAVNAESLDELVQSFNRGERGAARSLGKIGAPAIPALRKALVSDDWKIRHGACYAFTVMGENGKDAIPEIMKLIHDENINVRLHAGMALSKMGDASALALGKALEGGDTKTKIAVLNVLIPMKTKGKPALPAVTKLLKSENDAIRKKAEYLIKVFSDKR